MCRAGRRRGDFPPPKGRGCCRRAAKLSSPAGAFARAERRKRDRHRISGRKQIRPPRRAFAGAKSASAASAPSSRSRKVATNSAPSALCLTHAVPRMSRPARRRSWPKSKGSPPPVSGRFALSARTSMPIMVARGRRLCIAGRALRRACRGARHRAHPLHDEPSRRHGCESHSRASGSALPDAFPASAGAIRFG